MSKCEILSAKRICVKLSFLQDWLSTLPLEIIIVILPQLEETDVKQLASVSVKWRENVFNGMKLKSVSIR